MFFLVCVCVCVCEGVGEGEDRLSVSRGHANVASDELSSREAASAVAQRRLKRWKRGGSVAHGGADRRASRSPGGEGVRNVGTVLCREKPRTLHSPAALGAGIRGPGKSLRSLSRRGLFNVSVSQGRRLSLFAKNSADPAPRVL